MKVMRRNYCSILLFVLITVFNNSLFSKTIHLNNQFISYTETGAGQALVLIHAFPTDKRIWEAQHEELQNQFHVISLDLWGFGESSAVDGSAVTMSDYANEIKQLLDYLHIKKAIIGGESMGGYIVLSFLEQHPDYVEGLILSNTQAISDSEETKENREKTALDVLEHGTDKFISAFMEKAVSSKASDQTKSMLSHILSMQKPQALASALRGMALRDQTQDVLANSSVPILIITSSEDKIISPQQSENMHHLAKNSQLVVIADAGHLSNLEQPQQWNQAIRERFLD